METDPALLRYCEQVSSGSDDSLFRIERFTRLYTPNPYDSSGFLQGKFLEFLSFLISPKTIVEIGTFTAYATVCLARGLANGGRLITIESKLELVEVIKKHLAENNLENCVELLIGDAKDVLLTLGHSIDMAYMDGAKMEYPEIYELLIERMVPGGLMVADNVLWKGRVVTDPKDKVAKGLHKFNMMVKKDRRNENIVLPFRDGLSLIRKL